MSTLRSRIWRFGLVAALGAGLLWSHPAQAERRTIAYSKSQGVEVQINAPHGVNWCQSSIPVFVLAEDANYFQEGRQAGLMSQIGPMLDGYCPDFSETYLEGRVKGTNALIYQGTAKESDGWSLTQVFLKPLDRGERLAIRDRQEASALYTAMQSADRPEKLAKLLDKDLESLTILRDAIGRSILSGEAQLVNTMVKMGGDGTRVEPVLWPLGLTATIEPGLEPLQKNGWYLVTGYLQARVDKKGGYPGGDLVIERWVACAEEACNEANDAANLVRLLYPDVAEAIVGAAAK